MRVSNEWEGISYRYAQAQDIGHLRLGDVRHMPGEWPNKMERQGHKYKVATVVGRGVDYQLLWLYVDIVKQFGVNIKVRPHRFLDDAYQ